MNNEIKCKQSTTYAVEEMVRPHPPSITETEVVTDTLNGDNKTIHAAHIQTNNTQRDYWIITINTEYESLVVNNDVVKLCNLWLIIDFSHPV